MKIEINDLILRKLEISDIELVRKFRNEKRISKHLIHQSYISKSKQMNWFKSIDWKISYYWMIVFDNKERGIIYINNYNSDKASIETNIFIFQEEDKGNPEFIRSLWIISFLCFKKFNFKILQSKIQVENFPALEIDKFFGFKEVNNNKELIFLECSKNDFTKNSKKIINLFFNKMSNVIIEEFETDSFISDFFSDKTKSINLKLDI